MRSSILRICYTKTVEGAEHLRAETDTSPGTIGDPLLNIDRSESGLGNSVPGHQGPSGMQLYVSLCVFQFLLFVALLHCHGSVPTPVQPTNIPESQQSTIFVNVALSYPMMAYFLVMHMKTVAQRLVLRPLRTFSCGLWRAKVLALAFVPLYWIKSPNVDLQIALVDTSLVMTVDNNRYLHLNLFGYDPFQKRPATVLRRQSRGVTFPRHMHSGCAVSKTSIFGEAIIHKLLHRFFTLIVCYWLRFKKTSSWDSIVGKQRNKNEPSRATSTP